MGEFLSGKNTTLSGVNLWQLAPTSLATTYHALGKFWAKPHHSREQISRKLTPLSSASNYRVLGKFLGASLRKPLFNLHLHPRSTSSPCISRSSTPPQPRRPIPDRQNLDLLAAYGRCHCRRFNPEQHPSLSTYRPSLWIDCVNWANFSQ